MAAMTGAYRAICGPDFPVLEGHCATRSPEDSAPSWFKLLGHIWRMRLPSEWAEASDDEVGFVPGKVYECLEELWALSALSQAPPPRHSGPPSLPRWRAPPSRMGASSLRT
jgi:hypothetical protein